MRKPNWLKQDTPVYHKPTKALFIAGKCVRRTNDEFALFDNPDGQGQEFLLSDCRKPELTDLDAGIIFCGGTPISIVRQGNLLRLSDGEKQVGVLLRPEHDRLTEAVQSFAHFFEGAVVSDD